MSPLRGVATLASVDTDAGAGEVGKNLNLNQIIFMGKNGALLFEDWVNLALFFSFMGKYLVLFVGKYLVLFMGKYRSSPLRGLGKFHK